MIEFHDVHKEYVNGDVVTKVLHGVSFAIKKGEFVSVMGPSGSGKSTLMHIMGFLDRLTQGIYFFEGKDTANFTDEDLARFRNEYIGFVFQSFFLLPKATIFENIRLPLVYSKKSIKEQKERVLRAIESVGLSHRVGYYPPQLSGGEKQRAAIARALVNDPNIIFADEPTGNLDSKSGLQIMSILQSLNEKGNTIILVTHETYTAEHAKRVIRIQDGKIEKDEPIRNRRDANHSETLK